MLKDLEVHAQQDPDDQIPIFDWTKLSDLAGNPPGRLPQEIIPLPGRVWPTTSFILGGVRSYWRTSNWDGALAFLAGAEPRQAPGPPDTEGWESARAAHTALAIAKVLPLIQLGKEGEALATLEEARHLAGSTWQGFANPGFMFPFSLDDSRLTEAIRTALKKPPLPDPPPPPAMPPLRLSTLGQPPWAESWGQLRHAGDLLPWSGEELEWGALTAAQAKTLRVEQKVGPGPRWVLSRGNEVLASGLACPTPGALAGILAAQGPTALQRLDAILERHPDHRAARRARIELLKARMPERRLEPMLVEDERVVVHGDITKPIPLDFGPSAPWRPDPALWQWAATQVLPGIQANLEQWPSSAALWIDWVAWSQFHPAKPSPVALAKGLPLWGSRSRWAGSLPMAVHKAVGQALKARGDHKGMADWFSEAWDAHPKTPAREIPAENWGEYMEAGLKEFGETVVKPYEEALVALGRSTEAHEIERTFRAMTTR
jgi:hypothetical protein